MSIESEAIVITAAPNFLYLGIRQIQRCFPATPEHITRFCYQIRFLGDPYRHIGPDNICEMSGPLYPRHNCADEECERQDGDARSGTHNTRLLPTSLPPKE